MNDLLLIFSGFGSLVIMLNMYIYSVQGCVMIFINRLVRFIDITMYYISKYIYITLPILILVFIILPLTIYVYLKKRTK